VEPFAANLFSSANKRYFCVKNLPVCRSDNIIQFAQKMTFSVLPLPYNYCVNVT